MKLETEPTAGRAGPFNARILVVHDVVGAMPIKPNRTTWRQAAALLAACVALVVVGGWLVFTDRNPQPRGPAAQQPDDPIRLITFDRPFPPAGRFLSDPYIGSRVCADCHPAESALHSRSGHAVTLRPASRVETSRKLDGTTEADPEIPGVAWNYRFADDRLHITRKTASDVLEHRLTVYHLKNGQSKLGITPGHDLRPPPPGLMPYGGVLPPRIARECFRCHATQLAAGDDEQRFDENPMIPNVSCERCHGPGKAHVAGARRFAPESELSLPFGPERYTAEKLLTLCGSCHRLPTPAQADRIKPGDANLVRFQPVGITQSQCY
jgi:hypothetical protein